MMSSALNDRPRLDQPVGKFRIGYRAGAGESLAAGLADRFGRLFGDVAFEIVDDHARAVAREQLGHGAPMPRPEPVTMATLPSISFMENLLVESPLA